MSRLSRYLFGGALAMAGSPALADVIDQNNPDVDVYMVGAPSGAYLSQTFQQTANSISGAGVYIMNFGGNYDVSFQVYDADPVYGGQPISGASGSVSGAGGTWVDAYWSPVSITAGQTYYLGISSNTGAPLGGTLFADKYANGSLHYGGFDYGQYGYDMSFRTWAPVPAPASAALLGLGALAVRRRRA